LIKEGNIISEMVLILSMIF